MESADPETQMIYRQPSEPLLDRAFNYVGRRVKAVISAIFRLRKEMQSVYLAGALSLGSFAFDFGAASAYYGRHSFLRLRGGTHTLKLVAEERAGADDKYYWRRYLTVPVLGCKVAAWTRLTVVTGYIIYRQVFSQQSERIRGTSFGIVPPLLAVSSAAGVLQVALEPAPFAKGKKRWSQLKLISSACSFGAALFMYKFVSTHGPLQHIGSGNRLSDLLVAYE